jgi:microcystin-dependent protein
MSNWGVNQFLSTLFKIKDTTDKTKVLDFDVSGITPSTTRTITLPDTDVDLTDIATNTTHASSDGTDHANVVTNDAHVAGDGSDHADVAANTTHAASVASAHTPPGVIDMYGGVAAPTGWLLCDGSSVSKTTYASLWAVLNTSKGAATISQANPGVVTFSTHNFVGGERVYFTTDGALPAGLSIDTTYWVTKINANTFKLSTTFANYVAGTYIETTDAGSGTHTLVWSPFGVASAANFLLPDFRGVFLRGAGTHGGLTNANGTAFVGIVGVQQNDKMQGHYHSLTNSTSNWRSGTTYSVRGDLATYQMEDITMEVQEPTTDGSNGTPRTGAETNPVNIGVSYIIKT